MSAMEHLYLRKIAMLDMLDVVLMPIAAGLWTAAVVQASNDFGGSGSVGFGPGIWLPWAICVVKICVIPAIALTLFIVIPGMCLLGWCLNCANPDGRQGDEWCRETMFCLCCEAAKYLTCRLLR